MGLYASKLAEMSSDAMRDANRHDKSMHGYTYVDGGKLCHSSGSVAVGIKKKKQKPLEKESKKKS